MAKLNITWPQFLYCNDNPTKAFEDMCRSIFYADILKRRERPHTDHNTPGVEVLPILESVCEGGQSVRTISFQAKYVEQASYAYTEFKKSARQTAKHFKGRLNKVYLFCNKTLTTTTKGYQEIVKIHRDAGIETVPISDVDLLDMINDYPDIAEYFFQKRRAADTSDLEVLLSSGITIYKIIEAFSGLQDTIQHQSADGGITKALVAEKLETCKKYTLEMEFKTLENELQKLFSFGGDTFEGAGTAYFYSFLIKLRKGVNYDTELKKCGVDYIAEAKWIAGFYSSPQPLSVEEFESHTPVIQIFITEKLFSPEHWRDIIHLRENIKGINSSIQKQFDLFYALSLFNIQEYEKAKKVLCNLVETTKDVRAQFYACVTDIRIENSVYQTGMTGHHEKLVVLLSQLESHNRIKQYIQQELLIASLRMETLYHLGVTERVYLDQAIEEYEKYSEETRGNEIVRFYYALCLEMNGNRDTATDVYESLKWRTDDAISERYMICCILNGRADKAISIYNSIDRKTSLTEAVYLFALQRIGADSYGEVLATTVDKYQDSLEDLIKIAFYTDYCDAATNVVLPRIKKLLTDDRIQFLSGHIRINLITILAQCGEIILLESVLKTIDNISSINSYTIFEIYKALFEVASQEYEKEGKGIEKPAFFESAERIAKAFLATGSFKKYFLQIMVLCAGARQMPFSSLKYSRELFEITQDEEMARNIVALLVDRKETNPAEYEPYVDILEQSTRSDCCMAAASANLMLGREDAADYYAYKALYYLNDSDDYKVFKSFFCFCNYNLRAYQQVTINKSVRGSMVVTLEENTTEPQPPKLDICLDAEADLANEGNRSMGIEHLTPSNPDYMKLRACGLNQVIRFRGGNYKITRIISRVQFGLSYVFGKIQNNPEMFRDAVCVITTADASEMIKQIRELTDNSEQINTLLDLYHFKENNTGIPLDMLTSGDYGRYIDAVKFLLYCKDEAFYAGQPVNEDETNQQYVPSLSTFVVLAILGRIDVLEAFKSQVIIPKSYISFIQNEYAKAARVAQTSSSTLFFVEGRPVMQETDKTLPELWESIFVFCKGCVIESIADQERIDAMIANEVRGEQLFTDLNVSFIHLDALILAQKKNATLLCDDLFFRKIATWMNVRNLNIVSLIQHYADLDFSVPIIKELSKTNYIYLPIIYRNDEDFGEIIDNLMDGEKKNRYYGDVFRRFFEVRNQLLRQIFGDVFDK